MNDHEKIEAVQVNEVAPPNKNTVLVEHYIERRGYRWFIAVAVAAASVTIAINAIGQFVRSSNDDSTISSLAAQIDTNNDATKCRAAIASNYEVERGDLTLAQAQYDIKQGALLDYKLLQNGNDPVETERLRSEWLETITHENEQIERVELAKEERRTSNEMCEDPAYQALIKEKYKS